MLNCFDYILALARVIGFLSMYHDGVLCATYHDREAILGQNMPFFGLLCCCTFIFVFFRLLLYNG